MAIVCLVGSTKFKEAFIQVTRDETLKGNIVLSVGVFGHQEDDFVMDSDIKRSLDKLHMQKIDLCDEVLVLNCGDYIGVGACDEIGYAWISGKPVRYLETHHTKGIGGDDKVPLKPPAVCTFCGEVISPESCAYWPGEGSNSFAAHMGCADAEKAVYKIQSVLTGGFYFDDSLEHIVGMIDECDPQDGYTITLETMSEGAFKLLPEFGGF